MIKAAWISGARTALLLIDCQVDFGAEDGEMARRGADMRGAQDAVRQAEILAQAARAGGVRCVFVRLLTRPGGETPITCEAKQRRNDNEPDLCVEGTRGAAFIGPKPGPDDMIVTKARFSAFARTGLGERLHAQGIDTLVLAGLTSECCIQSSAWAAFEQDFHVFIAQDGCAAYDQDQHRHALAALEASGAVLASTAEISTLWKTPP